LSEPVCFFDSEPRLFRVSLRRLLLHHSSRARSICFSLLLASALYFGLSGSSLRIGFPFQAFGFGAGNCLRRFRVSPSSLCFRLCGGSFGLGKCPALGFRFLFRFRLSPSLRFSFGLSSRPRLSLRRCLALIRQAFFIHLLYRNDRASSAI
jgi:hypothetical protein